MSDVTDTDLEVGPELRKKLLAEAEAEDTTVSAFLARLLHDHVARKTQAKDYDQWFDAEIGQALAEADDPQVERVPDNVVRADLERRMAALQKRV